MCDFQGLQEVIAASDLVLLVLITDSTLPSVSPSHHPLAPNGVRRSDCNLTCLWSATRNMCVCVWPEARGAPFLITCANNESGRRRWRMGRGDLCHSPCFKLDGDPFTPKHFTWTSLGSNNIQYLMLLVIVMEYIFKTHIMLIFRIIHVFVFSAFTVTCIHALMFQKIREGKGKPKKHNRDSLKQRFSNLFCHSPLWTGGPFQAPPVPHRSNQMVGQASNCQMYRSIAGGSPTSFRLRATFKK